MNERQILFVFKKWEERSCRLLISGNVLYLSRKMNLHLSWSQYVSQIPSRQEKGSLAVAHVVEEKMRKKSLPLA